MSTLLNISKRSLLLIILTIFILSICSTRAAINEPDDMEESDELMEYRRREADFKKLRHFLLTSNDDQRAARREKQLLYKRKLVKYMKTKRCFLFFLNNFPFFINRSKNILILSTIPMLTVLNK